MRLELVTPEAGGCAAASHPDGQRSGAETCFFPTEMCMGDQDCSILQNSG